MSPMPTPVHFIWMLPGTGDANFHLRNMIISEARAVPACGFSFFQATDYIKLLQDLEAPSLVVFFGSFYKPAVDLQALIWSIRRRWDAPIAAWLTDDPYEFDVDYPLPRLVNFVFSNDKNSCQYFHADNVFHLPLAASEAVHAPAVRHEGDDEWDFIFCGVGFPNRVVLLRGLQEILRQHSTLVIGSGWPTDLLAGLTHRQHISYGELLRLYGRSKIVLNMSRTFDLCNARYEIVPSTPNPRVFEVAAMGLFQLTFYDRPELYEYYEPDEMITYATRDEFAFMAQTFLEKSDERARVAQKAHLKTITEHLYRHRLQHLHDVVFSGC